MLWFVWETLPALALSVPSQRSPSAKKPIRLTYGAIPAIKRLGNSLWPCRMRGRLELRLFTVPTTGGVQVERQGGTSRERCVQSRRLEPPWTVQNVRFLVCGLPQDAACFQICGSRHIALQTRRRKSFTSPPGSSAAMWRREGGGGSTYLG